MIEPSAPNEGRAVRMRPGCRFLPYLADVTVRPFDDRSRSPGGGRASPCDEDLTGGSERRRS